MLVEKRNAGRYAADFVKDGMIVGLGTGSTAQHAIQRLGVRCKKEGLEIIGIPTSERTKIEAEDLGIPISSLDEHTTIDITIEGADEIDPELNLIKGGGGALLREKIVAYHSKEVIIVADPTKMVDVLGVNFKLPVEIIPFCSTAIISSIEELDCSADLRMDNNTVFKTDNNNYITDCKFHLISDPRSLSRRLNDIPGVVENGLFVNVADRVIIGKKEGVEEISID